MSIGRRATFAIIALLVGTFVAAYWMTNRPSIQVRSESTDATGWSPSVDKATFTGESTDGGLQVQTVTIVGPVMKGRTKGPNGSVRPCLGPGRWDGDTGSRCSTRCVRVPTRALIARVEG